MAEPKRRGWLSRLFGGDKPAAPPPDLPLAPPPTPGVQALDLLFGQPGQPRPEADDARVPPEAVPQVPRVAPAETVPLLPAPTEPAPTEPAPTEPAIKVALVPVSSLDAAVLPAVQLRIVAHIANRGDVKGGLDAWVGERGSGLHMEGLSFTAIDGIDPDDLEYRALLDDGSLTDWHRDEAYCGTRGESRPLHGFALRLVGPAAGSFRVSTAAVFSDGSEVGPVGGGELCAAAGRAALEAIYIMVDPAT